MMHDIFSVFWFFLPAGLANMFPIFAAHTPGLKNLEYPMDFNLNFRGRRVLGPHKTIRGLITAIIVGIIVVLLQQQLYQNWDWLRSVMPVNYSDFNPYLLGFLLGFGAIIGDAVKSFFKRQIDINSGESWFFFDQVDYIIGGILFTYCYAPLEFKLYLYLIVVYFILHLASTVAGNFLGLKRDAI